MITSNDLMLQSLHMARDLVFQEYTERRNQAHQKWLYDSDASWRMKGIRLPYPVAPDYPTEQQIVDRAQVLLTYLTQNSCDTVTVPTTHEPDHIMCEQTVDQPELPEPPHDVTPDQEMEPCSPEPDHTEQDATPPPEQPPTSDSLDQEQSNSRHWGISSDHVHRYAQLRAEQIGSAHVTSPELVDVIAKLEMQKNDLRRALQH